MNKIQLFLSAILTILFFSACSDKSMMQNHSQATVIQTSRAGDNLKNIGTFDLVEKGHSDKDLVELLPGRKYQQLVGFGGAFTESAAYVLKQLDPAKRTEVLNAYFSPAGAAYSLTRTHINSCDFSLNSYAYANTPGDTELKDFSIKEDMDDLVPLIRDALAVEGAAFKIISSPWTAPPWMKDNNNWYDGSLKPEYYPSWALYFSKYIKAYEKEGIPIWAVTVENEPLGVGGSWESMTYTPAQMADFIKNHLGPRFVQDGIKSEILIFDHNRDKVKEWAEQILSDTAAARFIWGTALHWYSSTIDWYPDTLNEVHSKFPDKHVLHTEACIDNEVPVWQDDAWYWKKEATDWGYQWASEAEKPLHPKYVPVYRYARDIIGGLNSWLTGWVDWNIVLDDKGGPNHVHNWCIAPVLVKPETKEVYYTPLYYVMCHFSKYMRPGAVRIGVSNTAQDLMIVACQNTDNSLAVAVLNQSEHPVNYQLKLAGKLAALTIPDNALQTIILQ
jgi:glucosylceramidase